MLFWLILVSKNTILLYMDTEEKIKKWKEEMELQGYDLIIKLDLKDGWPEWFFNYIDKRLNVSEEDIAKILAQLELLLEEKNPTNKISGKAERFTKIINYLKNNVVKTNEE